MSAPAPAEPIRLFTLRFLAILFCLAGTAHIVSVLAAMRDTSRSAYARLEPALPANTMTIMPAVQPGSQFLPFMSADARYALCHFDSRKGPVAVTAELLDLGWTIAVFNKDGSSAYFAAAPAGRATRVSLTIVPGDDRFMGLSPEAQGKISAAEAPLTVTAKEGLVVVRAPDKGLSYAGEAEAGLARAACAPASY